MVKVDLVAQKAHRLGDVARALAGCLPVAWAALDADRDKRDLVAFRVYLVMQEAVDLAAHVIADRGWGPAPNLRDHFGILASKGVIAPDVATDLSAGIKIRNLIGHAYVEIDAQKLHTAAMHLIRIAEPYCKAVLDFAEANPT